MTTMPIHRTIPAAAAAAALLALLAGCEETAESDAVEGDGDAVVVVPESGDGVATDG